MGYEVTATEQSGGTQSVLLQTGRMTVKVQFLADMRQAGRRSGISIAV